ncbi:MAG: hypothetical protein ABWY06_11225 [Pseudomonas sp.]|uniref:hypothetical protein n=1 Tax=Pseudomonas sp. TaxID=306 RepID=UPI0033979661
MSQPRPKARPSAFHLTCVSLSLTTCLLSATATAQPLLRVSQPTWAELTPVERNAIQKTHVVELVALNAFGLIMDNQSIDESRPGTSGGARLGETVAQASYIDHAFKDGNRYSAKNQLAIGLLGALVGASMDQAPQAQFHHRYAVKLGTGNVEYFDEVKGDGFRHSPGVCIAIPALTLTDQQLCSQTAASLRALYLPTTAAATGPVPTPDAKPASVRTDTPTTSPSDLVNCKSGTLAPVRTTAKKCALINGIAQPQ